MAIFTIEDDGCRHVSGFCGRGVESMSNAKNISSVL